MAGEVWGIDLHGLCVFAATLDETVIWDEVLGVTQEHCMISNMLLDTPVKH